MSFELQALGHSIESPLVKTAMRALGVKAPGARTTARDHEGNIYEAEAKGTRATMTFMGYVRYVQDYGAPRSRKSRDDNELILVEIDLARRGVELPYELRLGDLQEVVVDKLGKKPRERSTTDYGAAWWFYLATHRLIAAFDRAGRLEFLRVACLDLGEQKRAATKKTSTRTPVVNKRTARR